MVAGSADAPVPGDDERLVRGLRAGDQTAFAVLIDRFGPSMLRVARTYVSTTQEAEDVVQDAWLGIVRGIHRFEGRSSLKTWIFTILVNRARSRGSREARTVPFSSLDSPDDQSAVGAERFHLEGGRAGSWATPPVPLPEERILAREVGERLLTSIDRLPPQQRALIMLRDVQGFSATEAREILDLSEANQRVMLHRARCRVRAELEDLVSRS